jgi:hypothetical protein
MSEAIKSAMKRLGVSGVNKPKRTPGAKKSHVVLVSDNGKPRTIRFGQQGVSGSPKKEGESESYRKRRESFKARHAKNIAKGKMSAAYWADRVKWATLPLTQDLLSGNFNSWENLLKYQQMLKELAEQLLSMGNLNLLLKFVA